MVFGGTVKVIVRVSRRVIQPRRIHLIISQLFKKGPTESFDSHTLRSAANSLSSPVRVDPASPCMAACVFVVPVGKNHGCHDAGQVGYLMQTGMGRKTLHRIVSWRKIRDGVPYAQLVPACGDGDK